jgi:hypothetical protein
LGGGAACLAAALLLNLPAFYRGLFGYAARAVFPDELYVEIQQWDYCTALIFQGAWPAVAVLLLVLSCVSACFLGNSLMRGFAASVAVFLGYMIAITLIYVYSGIRWNLPLPYYMELPAHPAYVVAGLLGAWLGWRKLATRIQGKAAAPRRWAVLRAIKVSACLGSVLAVPSLGMFSVFAQRAQSGAWADARPGGLRPPRKAEAGLAQRCDAAAANAAPENHDDPKGIVKFLEEELAIREDGRFRGSVANLIGVPGGPLMDRLGVPEEAPFEKWHIEFLDGYYRTFDPHLHLSGLWDLRIPTLENNSHMVTPPFHFLVSRALSRPQDYHSRNWALATLARPSLMAALGTRFLLSDRLQSDPRLALRAQQVNGDGLTAYAYEIRGANLGDYSPLRTVIAEDAAEMISLMKDERFDFRDAAIVETPIAGPLTRAKQAGMFFEKGGVRVRAASEGPSLLVLPVQFSNSLRIVDAALNAKGLPIEFRRVNLLETGLLFAGRIDIKFANVFGPLRDVAGRLRDIDDCRRLGIRETGEIPYPPGYQPLAPGGWKIQRGLMP